MDEISLKSPAKINLFLEILGKNEDHYHEIFTVIQEISLADEITIKKSSLDYSTLRCNDPSIPFGKKNLCIKAVDVLKQYYPFDGNIEVTLNKRIPLGAGLGGGSSNAATILKGLNKLFKLGLSTNELIEVTANIGSDVPFFIKGNTCIATGRGEKIKKISIFQSPLWLVLVKPHFSISTESAYGFLDSAFYNTKKNINNIKNIINRKNAVDFLDNLYNCFESALLQKHPVLQDIKIKLMEAGCRKSLMTGSGSAIFGICDNKTSARKVLREVVSNSAVDFAEICYTVI